MKNSLCRIVFVNNSDTAMDLKAFFVEQNPKYISEINDHFLSYRKIGPFKRKNKKSLFKLFCDASEVKEVFRENGKEEAARYVRAEISKMDLDHLMDCSPVAMSGLQRLRASCVYNVLDNKYDFLLCDCEWERIEDKERRLRFKSLYFRIAEYMRCSEQYEFAMYDLVWITDLSVDEMLELLGNSAKEEDYRFFQLDDHDIVELDKEKLLKDYTKADSAYEEARKYDRYFRTLHPEYRGKDDLKKAFELYKSAAEMGHPGARLALGDLYNFGCEACVPDKEKALYWYIMAEYNKDCHGRISDGVLKEVHYLAPMGIQSLVLEVPSGRELLRKYAGEQAEELIKKAEFEEKVKKLCDNMPTWDQEELNKDMRKALEWIRNI